MEIIDPRSFSFRTENFDRRSIRTELPTTISNANYFAKNVSYTIWC